MTIIQSIILGILQGVGEFLPISSSAHLILIPYLLGWQESSMAFDIALHFGTLLAVLAIYFKDWWNLFIGAIKNVNAKKKTIEGKMFWYLVAATIPAAIVGFILDDIIENFFRGQIWLIALFLALMGIFIYVGDRWASKHYKGKEIQFENITLKQAFLVGCSQALLYFLVSLEVEQQFLPED
jgi:undecaprenyl-diphosphatase